jgi:hypothetical protein
MNNISSPIMAQSQMVEDRGPVPLAEATGDTLAGKP